MGISTARPKRGRGGRGRGIYPTWASGIYLTGGGVYLTKVVSCYPFPFYFVKILNRYCSNLEFTHIKLIK